MHPEITDWEKEKLSGKEYLLHSMINVPSEKYTQHEHMDFFYGSEEQLVEMEV
jgi:putative NADPH-quinone reductase